MARSKKSSSKAVDKALTRAAAVESFDPVFDMGNGVSLAALREKIAEVQAALAAYNTKLSEVDGLYNTLVTKEKELNTLNARVLAGVGVERGKDSSEYEQAGGTRTSEIQRRPRSSPTSEAAD